MKNFLGFLTSLLLINHVYGQSNIPEIQFDSIATKSNETELIIDPVETMPEFPGGLDSLKAFINRNNNWKVGKDTIVGKVFVEFIVEVDGSITNTQVLRGLNELCDNEAMRIVSIMPKWKPGLLMGNPIQTKMIIPILFNGMK